MAPMPSARYTHGVVEHGGKLYVVAAQSSWPGRLSWGCGTRREVICGRGGSDGSKAISTCVVFDCVTALIKGPLVAPFVPHVFGKVDGTYPWDRTTIPSMCRLDHTIGEGKA